MRIAIYGRKSKWTGKGESVENQLTMCREYIERFVDGGKVSADDAGYGKSDF